MKKMTMYDAVVVGAGPAGLILANQLANTELSFCVLERNDSVGGIWNIRAPNTPMYESAHFISSKTKSGFPGFPMPEDFPDYPSQSQLFTYIKAYAETRDLLQYIQFHTSVKSVERHKDDSWQLNLEGKPSIRARYLICANGVTWEPNIVDWQGDFNGEIRHSVTYKSTKEFEGKRVLVVGAGNSGVDIACDASFTAEQAFISVRRGYHFVPKHLFGKPADVFSDSGPKLPFKIQQTLFGAILRFINGDLRNYGLPKPDHKVFETHPIMNTQILHYLGHGDCIAKTDIKLLDGDYVEFADGSREKIDLIIAATGYKHAIPFLDEGVIPEKDGRPDLYLNMFSRHYDNLAALGFIEFASAAYEKFSSMAELIVADAQGKTEKLQIMKKSHRPDLRGGHTYLPTQRNANYVDVETYIKTLNKVKLEFGITA